MKALHFDRESEGTETAASAQRKLSGAYRSVFQTPQGHRVLRDLHSFCGAGRPSFVRNESETTAFNEGMRRVWLRIDAFLNMDDSKLVRILKEEND